MRMRTFNAALIAAIATAIAATACAPVDPDSPTNPPPTQSVPAPTDSTKNQSTPAPDVADDDSQTRAIVAAEEAVDTWLTDPSDRQKWWERMSKLMTSEAWSIFVTVDPARIIPAARTGSGRIAQGATGSAVTVFVPTSDGDYTVRLLRVGDDGTAGTWRVTDIGTTRTAS